MKKTLLSIATLLAVSVSAQGVGSNYAYDDFAKSAQYSTISTESLWDSLTHTTNAAKKAYKGIFWWTKPASGGLDFTKVRTGNGVQTYTVNQAASAYEPFGVGFGTYGKGGKDSAFFTIDMSKNAVVSFTIKNTSTVEQSFKLGLGDINDTLLNAYTTGLEGYNGGGSGTKTIDQLDNSEFNAPFYLYELEVTLAAGKTETLSVDFSKAAHVYYKLNVDGTVRTDGNVGCKDVGYYSSASTFDFTKVKSFTITPLNSTGLGVGEAPSCYGKEALTAGTFEISNFKMGDVPVSITDELVTETFKDENVTVYNMVGSIVATGTTESITLNPGFYIIKSATKTQKVIIK